MSFKLEVVSESIYDHPKYYDLVFGADCAAETRFIMDCAHTFLDRKAQRMFEPACGTGRLLAQLGKRGFDVGGLDLNPKAIDFCNARFKRNGFAESAFVADMSNFSVPKPYDVGFNTINSFRHLSTEKAARDHLICMGNAIRPGGLYLLGVHLTPTEVEPSEGESWSARRGKLAVDTHMWTVDRDSKKRVERFGIRFDVQSPSRNFRIEDVLVLRSYTAKQMDRLIRSSEVWETLETFDFGYEIEAPIEVDGTCEDVVYVLERKS